MRYRGGTRATAPSSNRLPSTIWMKGQLSDRGIYGSDAGTRPHSSPDPHLSSLIYTILIDSNVWPKFTEETSVHDLVIGGVVLISDLSFGKAARPNFLPKTITRWWLPVRGQCSLAERVLPARGAFQAWANLVPRYQPIRSFTRTPRLVIRTPPCYLSKMPSQRHIEHRSPH